MNYLNSKEIFKKNNIKTPKFFTIKKSDFKKNIIFKNILSKKIKFPVVAKPINEGSSLGVVICNNKEKLFKSIKNLLKKYNEIMLEEHIAGQEVQVAVINGKPLGAIELIPKDYFTITKPNTRRKQ